MHTINTLLSEDCSHHSLEQNVLASTTSWIKELKIHLLTLMKEGINGGTHTEQHYSHLDTTERQLQGEKLGFLW